MTYSTDSLSIKRVDMKKLLFTLILILLTSQVALSEEMKLKEIDESRVNVIEDGEEYNELREKRLSLLKSQKIEFQNIGTLGFLVENIDDGYDFTTDDLIKHVYNRLKSSLAPSINLCNRLEKNCAGDVYVYIRVTLLKKASSIEVSLKRDLLLPDKLTRISGAIVWNRIMLMSGPARYSKLTDELDQILDKFSYECNQSEEYQKVDKEISRIMRGAEKKDKSNKTNNKR
jgi:hypothetical protein